MDTKDAFEEEILKEVREMPPNNRVRLLEIVHHLRLGITLNESSQVKNIKRFAGMWRDLSQAEIERLLSTYKNRESYFRERQIH